MQTFNDHFTQAYQISQGNGYIFNTQTLGITESEAAHLAKHVKEEAYEALGIQDKDNNWIEGIKSYFECDRNPLTITNTPDGLIIAVDQAGTVVYSQPYTDSLLTYAHRSEPVNKCCSVMRSSNRILENNTSNKKRFHNSLMVPQSVVIF